MDLVDKNLEYYEYVLVYDKNDQDEEKIKKRFYFTENLKASGLSLYEFVRAVYFFYYKFDYYIFLIFS